MMSNDGQLTPLLSETCVICSDTFLLLPKTEDESSATPSSESISNAPERLSRAFNVFCKLLGFMESGNKEEQNFTVSAPSCDNTDANYGGVELRNNVVDSEELVFGTDKSSCCNKCKNALLSILRLEEVIEETQASQRKHVESLKESLIHDPISTSANGTRNADADDVWSIRCHLISRLEPGPSLSMEMEDENDYFEPASPEEAKTNQDTDLNCGEGTFNTFSKKSHSGETPTKKRRGKSRKKPFSEHQNQNSCPKINKMADFLLLHNIRPCSVVIQKLKGYSRNQGGGDIVGESIIKEAKTKSSSSFTKALAEGRSDSSLGVRRSKLKAYNTIRRSLRLGDKDEDFDKTEIEPNDSSDDESESGDNIGNDYESDNGEKTEKRKSKKSTKKKFEPKGKVPKTNFTRIKLVRMLRDNLLIFRSVAIKYSPEVNLTCQAPGGCSTVVDGTDYFAFQAIKSHIMKNHTKEEEFASSKCPLCDSVLKGRKHLSDHLNQEHGPIYAICEVCFKPFKTACAVRPHMWLHKNEEEKAAAQRTEETCLYERQKKAKETTWKRNFISDDLKHIKGGGDDVDESIIKEAKNKSSSSFTKALAEGRSDSSLGVRRSKLKAYNTIKRSLRLGDKNEDFDKTGIESNDTFDDDFVPNVNDSSDESESGDNIGNDYESDNGEKTEKRKSKKGSKKKFEPKGKVPKTNLTRIKLVRMLRDNLLIFRSVTIKYSPAVSLACQAPGCSTVEDGTDYFAFQAIKSHIMKNHTKEEDFAFSKCPLCSTVLKGRKHLSDHLNQEHGPIYAICEVCFKPFKTPWAVRSHMWLHKNEEEKAAAQVAEAGCVYERQKKAKETCKRKSDHLKHIKDVGSSMDSDSNSKEKINQSKKTQADSIGGKKSRASQKFLLIAGPNLLLYKNTLIKNTQVSLLCQGADCTTVVDGTDYCSIQKIKDHVNSFHSKDKIKLPFCPMCGIGVKNWHRADHLPTLRRLLFENQTSNAGSYICETCWRPMKTTLSLKSHMWSHKNEEEKAIAEATESWLKPVKQYIEPTEPPSLIITCKECGKTFGNPNNYKAHQITHLPKELRKQFECTDCGLKLLSKPALRSHIERSHRPELASRPKICPICSRRFHYRDGERFRTHIRSHKGERPYQCHQCGKAFTSSKTLKNHANVHNPTSRDHQCEFCSMNYKYRNNLIRHRLSAHKELVVPRDPEIVLKRTAMEYRPDFIGPKIAYPCLYCDKVFPLRSRMTKHVKTAHPLESIPKPEDANVLTDSINDVQIIR